MVVGTPESGILPGVGGAKTEAGCLRLWGAEISPPALHPRGKVGQPLTVWQAILACLWQQGHGLE